MNEDVPDGQCAVSENNEPQRRRSARLTSPQQNNAVDVGDKMALPSAGAVKRSFVVRKIQPRKTAAVVASEKEHNNENEQRMSEGSCSSQANASVVDKMAPPLAGVAAVKRSIVVRKIEPRKTAAAAVVASVKEQHGEEEQRLSEGSILPDPAPRATLRSPRPPSDKRSFAVRKITHRKTAAVPDLEEHNNENEQRMSEGSCSSQANVSVGDKMAPPLAGAAAVKRSIVVRKIEHRKTAAAVVASVKEQHGEEEQRLSEVSILRRRPKPSIIPDPDPAPRATLRSPRPPSDKRSIAVRKITPRKTAEEHNKENEEQRLSEGCPLQKHPKISTPDSAGLGRRGPVNRDHSLKKTAFPSPILASPPRPSAAPLQPTADAHEAVWSQKVRRSYSRLSDHTIHNSPPSSRENLFGFNNLRTPEVIRKPNKTVLDISKSVSGVNNFMSWLEGDDCSSSTLAPDLDIPGVVMVKPKKRRNKVQKIDLKQVDELAAKMNAEFEEAEGFDLFVE